MIQRAAPAPLPADALLSRYEQRGHVDCYVTVVPGGHDLSKYIAAFYSSAAFRPERWLLGVLLDKWAGAAEIAALAAGSTTRFAAWTVEDRSADQILLCDYQGRTRSWLKVEPGAGGTRLYFGSAVVRASSGAERATFAALLGFHRWYSLRLLESAARAI